MEEEKVRDNNAIIKLYFGIFIAVFMIIVVARYITDDSFRSYIDANFFGKEVSDSSISVVELDTDANPFVFAYDKYIAIFSKNKLTQYTSDGKVFSELDVSLSVPLIASEDKYLAIAETNGQKIYLISGNSIIWCTDVEGNISRISVNKNGYVSVIITNTTYKSVIAYYDLSGVELFRTYLSTDFATCTAVSTNNKLLAIGEVDYSGTIVKSFVKIISVEKAESDPENSIVYTYESENGEIITDLKYNNKNYCTCMFSSYIQNVGEDSDSRVYTIGSDDIFVDTGLKDSIAVVDKQSSGLFSYEYEIKVKSVLSPAEKLYILDSELPKSMVTCDKLIALNLGNEVRIVSYNGWLKKKHNSSNQITRIVLGKEIAGIIYKNKIEIFSI